MQYKKQSTVSGAWANKPELYEKGIKSAKIVSETQEQPSSFKDEKTGLMQKQDVCKALFKGDTEAKNISLNKCTIYGLVDAFGEDSKLWQGHTLKVEIDKLPGKKYPLYFIPEGYKRIEDENGYSVIVNTNGAFTQENPFKDIPEVDLDEDDKDDKIPF
jgi:hypothetical protein